MARYIPLCQTPSVHHSFTCPVIQTGRRSCERRTSDTIRWELHRGHIANDVYKTFMECREATINCACLKQQRHLKLFPPTGPWNLLPWICWVHSQNWRQEISLLLSLLIFIRSGIVLSCYPNTLHDIFRLSSSIIWSFHTAFTPFF